MLRWYLVHAKPGQENTAERHLRRQGYEVYLPLVSQPIRRGNRWQNRIGPLFPRYLFIALDEEQSLAPVRSTIGVSCVVRQGGQYTVVPERVVRDLRSLEDQVTGLHRIQEIPGLIPGATVKVAAGPFNGLEGVFQRRAGGERVIVLLNILGRVAPVRIPHEFVYPSQVA